MQNSNGSAAVKPAALGGKAKTKLTPVSPSNPCRVCGGDHKCAVGADGLIVCGREQDHVDGFQCLGPAKKDPQFVLYRYAGQAPDGAGQAQDEPPDVPHVYWTKLADEFQYSIEYTDERAEQLLAALGLPIPLLAPAFAKPLHDLGVGWDATRGCWTLPEWDSGRFVLGICLRYPDGRKRMIAGGRRGLYFTGFLSNLFTRGDGTPVKGPIVLPEGFSDTLVLTALGISAIGRPSNTGGGDELLKLLEGRSPDRPILVLGEHDRKADGSWPGRDGAVAIASRLAEGLGRPVYYAFPPAAKDVRAWALAQDLGAVDAAGWASRRVQLRGALLEALQAGAKLVTGREAPLPFHEASPPPFPADALAAWQRDFVEAEATATQTPPDLVGMLTLSAASVACAAKAVVRVRDGYVEPVNIYTATALPPASRKSAVFRDVTAPVEEFEREEAAGQAAQIAEKRSQHAIDEKTLEDLHKKAAKAEGPERDDLIQQAGELAQQLAEAGVPRPLRLLADDATPERLEILLAENGGKMGILSAEGGIFDIMSGRYAGKGRSGNFEVYLKAHAGDALRVDRMNRPPVFIPRPALTLGLAVQPVVVQSLAGITGSRGRGLLGRILYSMPASTVGRRVIDPPPVPAAVRKAFRDRMRALLELSPGTDAQGEPVEHILKLTKTAYARWLAFAAWVEPQLADFGPLAEMADWAGKLPGAVARIAALLHLADRAGVSAPWEAPIPAATMGRAIRIGQYLIPHARAAFALIGCDPLVEDARYLLGWIGRQAAGADGVVSFTRREAFEGTKGRFGQVSALEFALGLLERHNYISTRPAVPQAGRGRPPSPTYDVHPLALDAGDGPSGGATSANIANIANFAKPSDPEKNGPPPSAWESPWNSPGDEEDPAAASDGAQEDEYEEGVI